MATFLNDIALYLAANAVGTIGTNLFWGQLPDTPDSCSAVIEANGSGSIHANTVVRFVSVLIRGKDFLASETVADAIYFLLHNKQNIFQGVGGTTHATGFSRMERTPLHIGKDSQGRHIWTLTAMMNVNAL